MAKLQPEQDWRRTVEVEIDPDQAYFWTEEWQAEEREATQQGGTNEGQVFFSARDFLRALDTERAQRDGI
jgi:hypothetical protein